MCADEPAECTKLMEGKHGSLPPIDPAEMDDAMKRRLRDEYSSEYVCEVHDDSELHDPKLSLDAIRKASPAKCFVSCICF